MLSQSHSRYSSAPSCATPIPAWKVKCTQPKPPLVRIASPPPARGGREARDHRRKRSGRSEDEVDEVAHSPGSSCLIAQGENCLIALIKLFISNGSSAKWYGGGKTVASLHEEQLPRIPTVSAAAKAPLSAKVLDVRSVCRRCRATAGSSRGRENRPPGGLLVGSWYLTTPPPMALVGVGRALPSPSGCLTPPVGGPTNRRCR